MIPARCLTSFNRFQLPSSEATPWLLQPHQGNMSRSWLRDTDSQNGDALLCIYYINDRLHVNKQMQIKTINGIYDFSLKYCQITNHINTQA